MNDFVKIPTKEKDWLEYGPEFGSDNIGEFDIFTRVLYGMKSSAIDFRNYFEYCMENMNYKSYLAYLDLWMMKPIIMNTYLSMRMIVW